MKHLIKKQLASYKFTKINGKPVIFSSPKIATNVITQFGKYSVGERIKYNISSVIAILFLISFFICLLW